MGKLQIRQFWLLLVRSSPPSRVSFSSGCGGRSSAHFCATSANVTAGLGGRHRRAKAGGEPSCGSPAAVPVAVWLERLVTGLGLLVPPDLALSCLFIYSLLSADGFSMLL